MIESKIVPDKYRNEAKFSQHQNEMFETEAKLASAMIERWGMVMGEPDGEDKAGRQKLKLMPIDKIVNRAFEASKLFMEKARENNLIHKLPTLEDLDAEQKKLDNKPEDK